MALQPFSVLSKLFASVATARIPAQFHGAGCQEQLECHRKGIFVFFILGGSTQEASYQKTTVQLLGPRQK